MIINSKSCGVSVSMPLLSTALVVLVVGSTGLLVRGARAGAAGDLHEEFDLAWGGDQRAKIQGGGKLLTLSLDHTSGSGFVSKRHYLFARIDMQIKLVAGNSAGTVTAFYMSSEGANRDEIDFEFLGNVTGEPYIVHTNVYTQGNGEREQQFYLWFDPTKNFHTYSILWNPQQIMFLVDNIPIRVFGNKERIGVPFPNKQPMKLYSSLWNADQWATRGGLVKTDWSKAPFTAFYRNFNAGRAAVSPARAAAAAAGAGAGRAGLDPRSRRWLTWVRKHYMIYNYCTDLKRFPQGRPRECKSLRF